MITALRCVLCGKTYGPEEVEYTCPACGTDGTLDVLYDYEEAARELKNNPLSANRDFSMWRYGPLLPVAPGDRTGHLQCGWTPLYLSRQLGAEYGVKELWIKDDGRNPTGSLKDRASAVAVARAAEVGSEVVACSSTGNAASSLSGFAAVAGFRSFIFVPESAPPAKVAQLLIYGSYVLLVQGDYSDAFSLSMQAVRKYHWYNRNCAVNPYLVEGKKTVAMEMAEQLDWQVPDYVFIAVGDGCSISGLYKGFWDLMQVGLVSGMPRLIGVQADGCQPIHRAIKEGTDRVAQVRAATLADSIAVGSPRNWAKALRAIRTSGGDTVTVTDDEILAAMRHLARKSGVFGEPAGAASFAGFQKMAKQGCFRSTDRVAIVVTGTGLKDVDSAMRAVGHPLRIEPRLEALAGLLPAY